MASTVDDWARRQRFRAAEKERGAPASIGQRFLSQKTAELLIPAPSRLPVSSYTALLQDPITGEFYQLPGYSDPDGPDLPLP